MINPMNPHYALENPASIYDEEALTALELAGRTTAKVNECVEAVNQIPEKIAEDVQTHIDSGEFNKQVDKYAGELKKQIANAEERMGSELEAQETHFENKLATLNNRMNNFTTMPSGSTTNDAELQDIRVWWNGNTSANAGEAVRGQMGEIRRESYQASANFGYCGWHTPLDFTIEVPRKESHYCAVHFTDSIGLYAKGGRYEAVFNNEVCADLGDDIEIRSQTSATIYIGIYKSLVYNITDMKLHFRNPGTNLQANDICLIKTGYAYPVGGTLFDQWSLQRIKNHNTRITALESPEVNFTGDNAVKHYASLMNNTGNVEKFLFFTDPHLCEGEGWEPEFFSYMSEVKQYHDASAIDFVVCGGDWLGNGDTQAGACYKLGFIASQMRKLFPRYYPVIGNHDTNYQGILEQGSGVNTGMLTRETVRNLFFQGQRGGNYYSFKGASTTFFVFDTDLDWDAYNGEMIPYYTEQFNWFMNEVEKVTGNIALIFHMAQVTDNEPDRIHPLVTNVLNYCAGFNSRKTGAKVRFALCGHLHCDNILHIGGIPVIGTTNLKDGGVTSFDMCLADYADNVVHMVRVGTGSHRTVNI